MSRYPRGYVEGVGDLLRSEEICVLKSKKGEMILGGSNNIENIDCSLGLGPHLAGRQIDIHGCSMEICKQLGEGGFSFVYLVRNRSVGGICGDLIQDRYFEEHSNALAEKRHQNYANLMVLKITSVHNTSQRLMAEKEAKLLQMLSHPSIVQVYDHGFCKSHNGEPDMCRINSNENTPSLSPSKSSQHLILMEYCEGGTAFDAIKLMKAPSVNRSPSSNSNNSQMFDMPSLVISFGQICNAVSYLHAQRPPIIHRDLKPVNFLIKNGAYKLCDFGSAVMGHTDLQTSESRRRAEEVVNKTTTQMFRAPEMVDLFMAKRLTQSTDVWALGCCLYSLAFLCDCFEDGSNLAILSCKYKIPDNNPYGANLVDLLDRMLAGDYKERADMSEVILCLSALYSNRPLPSRKWKRKGKDEDREEHRTGVYRTDGQGVCQKRSDIKNENKKYISEAKKLDPNSAAAKRKKANEVQRSKDMSQEIFSSVVGRFQNFASFEQDFEETIDSSKLDEQKSNAFSSIFDNTCQISSPHDVVNEPSSCNGYDALKNVFDTQSPQSPLIRSASPNIEKQSIIRSKKKRGFFGILKKSRPN